jgi:hypothetical protein
LLPGSIDGECRSSVPRIHTSVRALFDDIAVDFIHAGLTPDPASPAQTWIRNIEPPAPQSNSNRRPGSAGAEGARRRDRAGRIHFGGSAGFA